MVTTLILSTLAACLAAPPEKRYSPQCRPDGERCIGADNYPAVAWIPCCAGQECTGADTSRGGYGRVCTPMRPDPQPPQCRVGGARCVGEPGKPAVAWVPCCAEYECSAKDTGDGRYGALCARRAEAYPANPPASCHTGGITALARPAGRHLTGFCAATATSATRRM